MENGVNSAVRSQPKLSFVLDGAKRASGKKRLIPGKAI